MAQSEKEPERVSIEDINRASADFGKLVRGRRYDAEKLKNRFKALELLGNTAVSQGVVKPEDHYSSMVTASTSAIQKAEQQSDPSTATYAAAKLDTYSGLLDLTQPHEGNPSQATPTADVSMSGAKHKI